MHLLLFGTSIILAILVVKSQFTTLTSLTFGDQELNVEIENILIKKGFY